MDATGSGFDAEVWQQIVAERAITRVLLNYGRGVDEHDFARIRACFHEDAVITYGDGPPRSLNAAIAWLEEVVPALHALSHYFGPPIVDLSSDGTTATCQTWCINTLQYPPSESGEPRQQVLGLLYDDVFAYRNGAWLIAQRRNQSEWNLDIAGNSRLI